MPPVLPARRLILAHEPASRPAARRLVSLDLFRGITIAAMILVNNPGNSQAYAPLKHAEWNGWTPTDLIFPFFLFIVGVSMVFSFDSRLARGDSRAKLLLHAFRRSVVLFALGLLFNGVPHFQLATWRIPGVLQRIAVAYFLATLITLYCRTSARVAWLVILLAGYWLLLRYVPVPGYGVPAREVPFLDPNGNLVAHLDRLLMRGHLYRPMRDPEGLLSTFPSVASVLVGVLTGQWLTRLYPHRDKVLGMLAFGFGGVCAGLTWAQWFPINKNLWTSSYVLLSSGLALLALAACYWIADVRLSRGAWTKPFLVFGSNAILAYVLGEWLGLLLNWSHLPLERWLSHLGNAPMQSLLYSLIIVVLCYLPLLWLYRRGTLIKI